MLNPLPELLILLRWGPEAAVKRLVSAVLVESEEQWAANTKATSNRTTRMPDPRLPYFPGHQVAQSAKPTIILKKRRQWAGLTTKYLAATIQQTA